MIEFLIWCLFLIFSASSQTVSFYNQDESGGIQRVTFDSELVKSIFHGSFHKVRSSDVLPVGSCSDLPLKLLVSSLLESPSSQLKQRGDLLN